MVDHFTHANKIYFRVSGQDLNPFGMEEYQRGIHHWMSGNAAIIVLSGHQIMTISGQLLIPTEINRLYNGKLYPIHRDDNGIPLIPYDQPYEWDGIWSGGGLTSGNIFP